MSDLLGRGGKETEPGGVIAVDVLPVHHTENDVNCSATWQAGISMKYALCPIHQSLGYW